MTNQAILEEHALRCYAEFRSDPVSVRSALADASHICDAIALDILYENTGPGRRAPTKRSKEIAAALKRAGDAIWKLRNKVQCNEPSDNKG